MSNEIIVIKDLYQIQKTITFELKAYYELQDGVKDVEFKKTQDFVNQEYFGKKSNVSDGINELKTLIKFGSDLVRFADSFNSGLTQKYYDWFGFEANKTLIEKFDRDAYHRLNKNRRGIRVTMINPNTGKEFEKQLIFSGLMSLYYVIMMTDKTGYQLADRINQISDKIKFFQNKIETDLKNIYSKQTETEKVLFFGSGKSVFYGFVRSYIDNIKELISIFMLIETNSRKEQELNKKEFTQKIQEELISIKNKYKNCENTLKALEVITSEEAKKLIILTTLNPRAVNKDSKKVEDEYKKVLEMDEEMKELGFQLDQLNREKFEIVQKLEDKLKNSIPGLNVLKQDIQPIINKKNNNYNYLTNEEKETLKRHNFAKTALKYIKMEGVIINKKNDLKNYKQAGERLARRKEEYSQITKIEGFNAFRKEYEEYIDLCQNKKDKATKLGNIKSLYNSINREVLRQKEMQYLSFLAKDKDYFYLMLIDKGYNKENKIIESLETENQTSDWQMLKYHKITFKAIEKLALLDESTFDVGDLELTSEIKKIMADYKAKKFKEYKLSREEKYGISAVEQQERKKVELQKHELIKLIDYIQKKVIVNLDDCKNYNFKFKKSNQYQNIEEFVDEIDKQGYATKWININKEKLFELENKEGKNILVFKLHNRDFRKKKQPLLEGRSEKERKVNLFTKYWLDAMKLRQHIRLTPEIDIFKRKKEESESKIRILKTSIKEVVEKARIYQDKLYCTFRLEFYPTKKSNFEQVNQKVIFNENVHYLGLDRGVNSLASWCLVDSEGQIIKNGDWTTFKDLKNPEHETNYADKLKEYTKKKEELMKICEKISVCENEEVKKLENDLKIKGLLAAESIKKGYGSYLINEINQILKEYPNTYIVLEDLDIKGRVKIDETMDNKIQNLEKTFGGTVYQAIENAIVNKFKYYTVKDNSEYDGLQLVPNIVKVEDLRVVRNIDDKNISGRVKWVKSKGKVGNILFVDEYLTSKTCPCCGYTDPKGTKTKQSIRPKTNGDPIICRNPGCGFDTRQESTRKHFPQLRNGDDVAAYNIAKRGLEFVKKQKTQ